MLRLWSSGTSTASPSPSPDQLAEVHKFFSPVLCHKLADEFQCTYQLLPLMKASRDNIPIFHTISPRCPFL